MRLNLTLISVLSLFAAVFPAVGAYAAPNETGLFFNSHRMPQDERTSLNITPDGAFDCSDEFVLEFDILSRFEEYAYGYVFRIIADDAICLDMLSNIGWNRVELVLSHDHVLLERKSIAETGRFYSGEYSHVRVKVNRDRTIICNIDGNDFEMKQRFPECRRVKIFFGATRHPLFESNDVPPFSLKDVIFRDSDSKLYHWKLGAHIGNAVLDEQRQAKAEAVNAEWLIDARYKWKRLFSRDVNSRHPQLAFDPEGDRVMLALPDSVVFYDMASGKVSSMAAAGGHPISECGTQMYYDPHENELCCYSMNSDACSHFDISKGRWDAALVETWPQKSGQSAVLDPENRKQYIFGGYANHSYSSNLLVRDLDSGEVEAKDLSEAISPRYFSSVAMLPDGRLFVAGGYGSLTGRQADVPFNAYDSYFIDPSGSVGKGPALVMPDDSPAVFAGQGLVHGSDPKHVYALSFNNNRYKTQLQLVRISITDGAVEKLSAPIDYMFSDINSSAELSFSADSTMLFAYVLNSEKDNLNSLDIYSLAFPPVSERETLQVLEDRGWDMETTLFVLLLAMIAGSAAIWFAAVRRERKSDRLFDSLMTQSSQKVERKKYDIAMLGGLQILNAEGEDITSSFQPMLRKMMCLFVTGSVRDHKGLTSDYVDELLWPGMDKASASNNRNVNIRKLRMLLSGMKDVSLVYSKNIWTLVMGDGLRCDYVEICRLMQENDFSKASPELIDSLAALASRGPLLSDMMGEWADQLKSSYAQSLDDALMDAVKNPVCQSDPLILIRVADAMLVQDSLNEYSVKLKCRTLYGLGRKSYARKVYDYFSSEYERVMGVLPDFSFSDCLKNI